MARPSAARSLTRTTSAPPCLPPTPGRAEPGRTRTVMRTTPVCLRPAGPSASREASLAGSRVQPHGLPERRFRALSRWPVRVAESHGTAGSGCRLPGTANLAGRRHCLLGSGQLVFGSADVRVAAASGLAGSIANSTVVCAPSPTGYRSGMSAVPRTLSLPMIGQSPGRPAPSGRTGTYHHISPMGHQLIVAAAWPLSRPAQVASALVKAAIAGWWRSLARQRARVGPMLPTGMPSVALIWA